MKWTVLLLCFIIVSCSEPVGDEGIVQKKYAEVEYYRYPTEIRTKESYYVVCEMETKEVITIEVDKKQYKEIEVGYKVRVVDDKITKYWKED